MRALRARGLAGLRARGRASFWLEGSFAGSAGSAGSARAHSLYGTYGTVLTLDGCPSTAAPRRDRARRGNSGLESRPVLGNGNGKGGVVGGQWGGGGGRLRES